MAGIGFELKRVFERRGIFSSMKAYGYSMMTCIGPMVLAIVLQLCLISIARAFGALEEELSLVTSFISYTMIASMIMSSLFSTLIVRYVADCLFEKKYDKILPSFWGSTLIELVMGALVYGLFLLFSGIEIRYRIFNFFLFIVMITVWNSMNYLSALRKYKQISLAFIVAIVVGVLSMLFLWFVLRWDIVSTLIFSIFCAYGTILTCYCVLLHEAFEFKEENPFEFLKYFQYHTKIAVIGFFINLGLFGHIIIMWFSPMHQQLQGLFYEVTIYEVPSLFAVISIFVSIIGFVVTTETNFYPLYYSYLSLLNGEGSVMEVELAEKEMFDTLQRELLYVCIRQLFVSIIFIVFGGMIFTKLGVGMNDTMLGVFQWLCVGYAFYIFGNMFMTILLYFSDVNGVFFAAILFAITSILFTMASFWLTPNFYGLGFLCASLVFASVLLIRLIQIGRGLEYYILSVQPLRPPVQDGFWFWFSDKLYHQTIKIQKDMEMEAKEE